MDIIISATGGWGVKSKKEYEHSHNVEGFTNIDIDANTLTELKDSICRTDSHCHSECSPSSEKLLVKRKKEARAIFGSPMTCSVLLCSHYPLPGVQHCAKHIHHDPNW
eukprot:CFRG2528T1